MDRFTNAYNRTEEIMHRLFEAGFDLYDPWTIESINLPAGYEYRSGASRLVVWDNCHPDYVVKIALTPDDEKYCVHEVELYHAAVEAGVEAQFGWCEEISCYGEKSVYAMEFLDCDYDQNESDSYEWGYNRYCSEEELDSTSEESKRRFSNYYWSCCERDDLILEWFEDHLSNTVAAVFDRFIYDNDIRDIHPGNCGYRDGKLVLCDYAGWGW